ncbi:hypothetical protein RchiOBHm_Chr2g0153731 [Rosa chinensis]|uniref:Non-specific serine/threonine protein kinase n=1 Tax=Rosa chinensis TaxID=74649 RepID=A0A2P6S0R9_ROSCH|nr:hypothetical protein RchiOBHm_Chr2g0153731 [Rosa chinensis]
MSLMLFIGGICVSIVGLERTFVGVNFLGLSSDKSDAEVTICWTKKEGFSTNGSCNLSSGNSWFSIDLAITQVIILPGHIFRR